MNELEVNVMKVENQAAQGDVLFRRIPKLPQGVKEVKATGGQHVVAHSETGHHHTVDATGSKLYQGENDAMVCYLQLADNCESLDVVHHRGFDTHQTFSLLGKSSVWEVRRQREWTPEGWRRVED